MSEYLQVAPRYRSALGSTGLNALADFFAYDRGDCLDKPGLETWRQRWRMRLRDERGQERTFYLKRFDRPPLRRQWERWIRGQWASSTAGIEWANAMALAAVGVAAVEPAAFGQELNGPLELRSFVLLGEAPGESLERWVPAHLPPAGAEQDWRARRHRLDALARFVGRFHAAGFVHRDLYLCHIFYTGRTPDRGDGEVQAGGEFCLIDLQRVFRPRWRGRRWVVKDLAALDYSTPIDLAGRWERLRFLCRYVRACGRFGSVRQLAALVAARAARVARRQKQKMN